MSNLKPISPQADYQAQPRRTLCLGGPLHGTTVHVERPTFIAQSPSEGEHRYSAMTFSSSGVVERVYVHEGMTQDAAFASYLMWREVM